MMVVVDWGVFLGDPLIQVLLKTDWAEFWVHHREALVEFGVLISGDMEVFEVVFLDPNKPVFSLLTDCLSDDPEMVSPNCS